MSSVHLYEAEKKDFDMIYEMLMEFKRVIYLIKNFQKLTSQK